MAVVRIRGGTILLYKRPDSPNWQAELRLPKGVKKISTKTADEHEAAVSATKAYEDLISENKPLKNKNLFGTLALNYYQTLISQNAKPTHKIYAQVLQKWIEPYFGKMDVTKITDDTIVAFEKWREQQLGRVPSTVTINTHNTVLRRIFEIACTKKIITKEQVPTITVKDKGMPRDKRGSFDDIELTLLIPTKLDAWINDAETFSSRYKRSLLKLYVGFLLATGARPGREVETLRWRNIKTTVDSKGQECVQVFIQSGKCGKRRLIASNTIRPILDKIRALTKRAAPDDLIFAMPDGTPAKGMCPLFNTFLKLYGLKYDAAERERSLYSCRHSYITQRVRDNKVPESVLAENCGTSPEMIRKFYSDASIDDFSDRLAK